jgi:hypothetical protein
LAVHESIAESCEPVFPFNEPLNIGWTDETETHVNIVLTSC